jgi:hypothetical protein
MRPGPLQASAIPLGLAIALGGLCAATARATTVRAARAPAVLDCGAGFDRCMQACHYDDVLGGRLLGKCNDDCAVSTSVCEASRIPRPAAYRSRSHSHSAIGRK